MRSLRTSRVGDLERVQTASGLVPRAFTETTLGKGGPKLARVGTASEEVVGVDDSITSLDEVGVARLERHTVHDKFHGEILAIGRHAVVIEGRHVRVVLAVLVDQVPQDFVQHGSPDVADGVDAAVQLDALVGLGVDGHRGRVQVVADTGGVAVDPRTHAVVLLAGVAGLETDGGRVEVGPALAHTTGLEQVKAPGVPGTTGETVGQTVSVLMDDDTGLERAVAYGLGVGPDVPARCQFCHVQQKLQVDLHPHAAGLAIWGSGEVRVVSARAVLSVQEDEVVANTTGAVVVDLEVTGALIETELVQQVVVLVGGVEQLGNGGIGVCLVVGGVQVQGVVELEVTSDRARVVEESVVCKVVLPVGLRNTVVTTGCLVPISTVRVPAELGGVGVKGVLLIGTGSLSRVVDTPLVDLVAVIGTIVDNSFDALSTGGIDIGQEPVGSNVCLDPPSQLELAVGADKVDELGLRLVQTAARVLDCVSLLLALGLSLGGTGFNRKPESADSGLQGVCRVGGGTLLAWSRDLALEKRATEGENLSVLADLRLVSLCVNICNSPRTYVNVEISVVDVKTVGGLLEVEVRNAVLAGVVVVNQAELGIGSLSGHKIAGGLFWCSTSPQGGDGRVGIHLSSILVLGLDDHTEFIEVDGTLRKRGRCVRVGMGTHGGHRGQGGDESGTHVDNEGLGTRGE